jgi:predicted  nucleic acid-binding Zn-ribbon protein
MTPNNLRRQAVIRATTELVRATNDLLAENDELRAQLEQSRAEALKWVHAEAAATDANVALQTELTDARQVIERMAGEISALREKIVPPF